MSSSEGPDRGPINRGALRLRHITRHHQRERLGSVRHVSMMATVCPAPKIPRLKTGVVIPPERPDWPTQMVVSLSRVLRPSRSIQKTSRIPARGSRGAAISEG